VRTSASVRAPRPNPENRVTPEITKATTGDDQVSIWTPALLPFMSATADARAAAPHDGRPHPHIAGPTSPERKENTRLLPKLSVDDSIKILQRRYRGALVCTTCARLIASTPMSYVSSNLTPEQVETYTCAECRTEPARAAHETARLRALPQKVYLKEPVVAARAYAPPQRGDESDAAYRRRVERWEADRTASHALLGVATPPHPYFGRCLVDGSHIHGSEYARECPSRKSVESFTTCEPPASSVDAEQSRAGSPRQQRRGSGTTSRLAGRRLTVRRQRTSPAQLAALARINGARAKQRGRTDCAEEQVLEPACQQAPRSHNGAGAPEMSGFPRLPVNR
jgi:hypothetical protein